MNRKIKQKVLVALEGNDLPAICQGLAGYDEHGLVNPLFSALSRPEERVRWHAISLFGQIVSRLADKDMEAARVVMRRFLWSLNDESGGIGWGAPEAMAEVIFHHDRLCEEYLHMLISYIRPDGPLEHQDGNFLELPALQQGVLWGIARLAEKRAALLHDKNVIPDLFPYLSSDDAAVRGLAARAIRLLGGGEESDALTTLLADDAPVRIYHEGEFHNMTVSALAEPLFEPAS